MTNDIIIAEEINTKKTFRFDGKIEFIIDSGPLGFKEFYFTSPRQTFYADNVKLHPLQIYDSKANKNLVLNFKLEPGSFNIIYGDVNKTHLIEDEGVVKNKMTLKNRDKFVFSVERNKLPLMGDKVTFCGSVDNYDLELFASLLCLFIPHSQVGQ